MTGFDQDDAAGLVTFDYHLLEKRTLLEAAAYATDEHTLQMQPSARRICPRAWKSRSIGSSSRASIVLPAVPASQWCPAVLERQLPATPAVGSLSSESTAPTLRRLRRCLTPQAAQNAHLCTTVVRSLTSDSTASPRRGRPTHSTQYSNSLQRCSVQIDSSPGRPEA